jgi:hypothetical protein
MLDLVHWLSNRGERILQGKKTVGCDLFCNLVAVVPLRHDRSYRQQGKVFEFLRVLYAGPKSFTFLRR